MADLTAASWCDLVIVAVTEHQDITTLMADPVTRDAAFGELLTWSLAGPVPHRYRPYADPAPLLTDRILMDQAAHALALTGANVPALGAEGHEPEQIRGYMTA